MDLKMDCHKTGISMLSIATERHAIEFDMLLSSKGKTWKLATQTMKKFTVVNAARSTQQ